MKTLYVMLAVLLFASQAAAQTGDIVLADGNTAKPSELKPSDVPIAVIVHDNLGLGLHRSLKALQWKDAELFAESYASNHNLPDKYASGWHIPGIEELQAVYTNRHAINATLVKLCDGFMSGLGSNWYWASTPSALRENYRWFIHFFNGYSADCPEDFDNLHAIVVRRF